MSDSWRRRASTTGLAESPTMPYTFRIPASTIWSTRISATVWAMLSSCVRWRCAGSALDREVRGVPHGLVHGLDRVGHLDPGDALCLRHVDHVDRHRRRDLAQPRDV